MANVAVALREEIRRLAKREVKAYTGTMKSAVAQYRREIASLKRHAREQAKKLAFLESQERGRVKEAGPAESLSEGVRYSARSVQAQRKRLGFSAADYAKLVGVSPLTIYNWEHGKSRPRKNQVAALVAVRGIGKREAVAKLALLQAAVKKAARTGGKRRKK